MNKLVLLTIFLLFEGISCYGREDIIDEYEPRFNELVNDYTLAHNTSIDDARLLKESVKNTTIDTMTDVQEKITTLQTNIAAYQTTYANNTAILSCLATQADSAASLNGQPINQTCWINADFHDLDQSVNAYQTLISTTNNTISNCDKINPLPTQDEEFLLCVVTKMLDLEEQYSQIVYNFNAAETAALDSNTVCVSSESVKIEKKVNEIQFNVENCIK